MLTLLTSSEIRGKGFRSYRAVSQQEDIGTHSPRDKTAESIHIQPIRILVSAAGLLCHNNVQRFTAVNISVQSLKQLA